MSEPIKIWIGYELSNYREREDHSYLLDTGDCLRLMSFWKRGWDDPQAVLTTFTSCWSARDGDGRVPRAEYIERCAFRDCQQVEPGLFFGGTPVIVKVPSTLMEGPW